MVSNKGLAEFGDFQFGLRLDWCNNIAFNVWACETGYFRFVMTKAIDERKLFNTTFGSHIISTLLFTAIIIYFSQPIVTFLK